MANEDDATMTEDELSSKRKFNAVSPAGNENDEVISITNSKESPMGNELGDGKRIISPC